MKNISSFQFCADPAVAEGPKAVGALEGAGQAAAAGGSPYALGIALAAGAASTVSAEVDAGTDDLCYDGRQLPQLFIVGAAKCGTTTLATRR